LQLVCNVSDANTTCNITAAVILPEDDSYEISLSKILPLLETARQYVIDENWLPPNVNLTFLPMDDRCSNVYSILRALHASSRCAHVFFGPSCEYALGEYLHIFTLPSVFSVSPLLASLLGNHRTINTHRCTVAE
jgi:atrial natriuretic peptide receptor A